jgi:Secretion system C-terminal sorting domain/FG-GAP repeat
MKNLILFSLVFFCISITNAQTPVSFYPSYDPIVAGFGSKVDLDGNEIIVSNASSLVYVFDKNANGLQQKQVIYSPNASDGGFGYAISIENNRIAIGDPLINSVAENAGSVFIYGKTGDLYDLQQIIPSPEPTANYHFGSCVKVFGNKLFITAENKVYGYNASSNVGSVYYYVFNGTEWVFQQKINYPESNFGNKVLVNSAILLIAGTSFSSNYVRSFKLDINGNYNFVSFSGVDQAFGEFDFCLDGNSFHTLYGVNVKNLIINEDGTFTQNDAAYLVLPQSEQIYGTIAVEGNDLFIGSTSYILQQSRKFPLLHYKKTGNTWTYHNTYYGIQPNSDDDYFGSVLAIKGNSLIIGAPLERIILPNSGNVYALDYLLANQKFERNGFSLFPNPTNNRVFVKNSNSIVISKIEIYSVSGKLLQTQNNNFNEISLENFSTGLYFAKIYSQNEVSESFKIVKN